MSAAPRRVLVECWKQRGALALFLWPVSLLYGALTATRRRLYRTGIWRVQQAGVPVIVVGNVVAGGGGKTPLVIELIRHLQKRGFRPGVISRGYGRRGGDCREVGDNSLAGDVGDEPILIRHATGAPVFVAAARIDAARALLARHPDINLLVSDDGLQHYAIYRDIEICVFDERGLGNGFLLPAGPLREPWPRPTDLVLSAGDGPAGTKFSLQRKLASHARRADGSLVALKDLRASAQRDGGQLWAVAGIAQPETFFAMLRAEGITLNRTRALPDHAAFDAAHWSNGNHRLVCTEKDAVKLWRGRPDALAVPLVLRIEPAFWEAFDKLLDAKAGAKPEPVRA